MNVMLFALPDCQLSEDSFMFSDAIKLCRLSIIHPSPARADASAHACRETAVFRAAGFAASYAASTASVFTRGGAIFRACTSALPLAVPLAVEGAGVVASFRARLCAICIATPVAAVAASA